MLTIDEQIAIMDDMKPYVEKEGLVDTQYAYDVLKALVLDNTAFCEMVGKAIIFYCPFKEINGIRCLNELFIFIPKEERGNVRSLLNILKRFEVLAREHDCSRIKMGSNYGSGDEKFVSFLVRLGYKTDTLYKEV